MHQLLLEGKKCASFVSSLMKLFRSGPQDFAVRRLNLEAFRLFPFSTEHHKTWMQQTNLQQMGVLKCGLCPATSAKTKKATARMVNSSDWIRH